MKFLGTNLNPVQKKTQPKKIKAHTPLPPHDGGAEGRLGTVFPPSWAAKLFELGCGPRWLEAILQCRDWARGKSCLELGLPEESGSQRSGWGGEGPR